MVSTITSLWRGKKRLRPLRAHLDMYGVQGMKKAREKGEEINCEQSLCLSCTTKRQKRTQAAPRPRVILRPLEIPSRDRERRKKEQLECPMKKEALDAGVQEKSKTERQGSQVYLQFEVSTTLVTIRSPPARIPQLKSAGTERGY